MLLRGPESTQEAPLLASQSVTHQETVTSEDG